MRDWRSYGSLAAMLRSVECPTCGAAKGDHCLAKSGNTTVPHTARERLAMKEDSDG